jgi:hypothetical protein
MTHAGLVRDFLYIPSRPKFVSVLYINQKKSSSFSSQIKKNKAVCFRPRSTSFDVLTGRQFSCHVASVVKRTGRERAQIIEKLVSVSPKKNSLGAETGVTENAGDGSFGGSA